MAERTAACTACHGTQGKAGPDGYYPRLAGKPAGYLYNQLRNFQEGRRHYTLMAGLLAPLDTRPKTLSNRITCRTPRNDKAGAPSSGHENTSVK